MPDAEHNLPSHLLAGQHRQVDEGIQSGLDGALQRAALVESLALLRLHLYAEEAILFPLLEKSGLTMPVFVMKREHGQMWPLIESLTAACESQGAPEAIREPCRQLFQLLQIHNPKEEQIVYTAADRLATEQTAGELAAALGAARLPGGWICAMAPH